MVVWRVHFKGRWKYRWTAWWWRNYTFHITLRSSEKNLWWLMKQSLNDCISSCSYTTRVNTQLVSWTLGTSFGGSFRDDHHLFDKSQCWTMTIFTKKNAFFLSDAKSRVIYSRRAKGPYSMKIMQKSRPQKNAYTLLSSVFRPLRTFNM